jgi:hypothetical protein
METPITTKGVQTDGKTGDQLQPKMTLESYGKTVMSDSYATEKFITLKVRADNIK